MSRRKNEFTFSVNISWTILFLLTSVAVFIIDGGFSCENVMLGLLYAIALIMVSFGGFIPVAGPFLVWFKAIPFLHKIFNVQTTLILIPDLLCLACSVAYTIWAIFTILEFASYFS